jgi:hypothetical protein
VVGFHLRSTTALVDLVGVTARLQGNSRFVLTIATLAHVVPFLVEASRPRPRFPFLEQQGNPRRDGDVPFREELSKLLEESTKRLMELESVSILGVGFREAV